MSTARLAPRITGATLPVLLLGACLVHAAPDVLAAQSRVTLPEAERRLPGEPIEVYAVGVAEGSEEELFSGVTSVAFDAAGNLYVLDRDNGRVQVFDPRGGFLRSVARKGGGPGELQLPVALAVTVEDRLVVTDVARRALSVFTLDGDFEGNLPLPEEWMPQAKLLPHPAGGVAFSGRPLPRFDAAAGTAAMAAAGDSVPVFWRTLDPGDALRTWYTAPAPRSTVQRRAQGGAGGPQRVRVSVMGPPTFSPSVEWTVLPGGVLAISHDADYSVRLVDGAGRTMHVLQRPIAPRQVTERDRSAAREQRRKQLTSGAGLFVREVRNGQSSTGAARGLPPEQIEAQLGQMEFADSMAVISTVAADPEGRVWVRRAGPPDRATAGPVDILSPEGRYLGTITGQTLPAAFGPGGLAAYIDRDEWEVERVVVRRLPAEWRSGSR